MRRYKFLTSSRSVRAIATNLRMVPQIEQLEWFLTLLRKSAGLSYLDGMKRKTVIRS